MARNRIKLAGGKYNSLKALTGPNALEFREVVITTDTHELFAGTGEGEFSLLGNVTIGTKTNLTATDPLEGRLYFDYSAGVLYVGTGNGWKRSGFTLAEKSGLTFDPISGDLMVSTDNETIVVNNDNELEVNNVDYGHF